MSRIRNIIYGLALGDAVGYRVEGEPYERIVNGYQHEDLYTVQEKMWVSDDTTMSLYLIKALKEAYDPAIALKEQAPELAKSIAANFLLWLEDADCLAGRGITTTYALKSLRTHLDSEPLIIDYFHGSDDHSYGSGSLMRAPWLGLLHAKGLLDDKELESLCTIQSLVTHRNLTAVHSSYVAARIISELHNETIQPGQVRKFVEELCSQQEEDAGWEEIREGLKLIDDLPEDYAQKDASDFDPSSILGQEGTAIAVLLHAIAFIDVFGSNPVEVLRRCILTGGDSDTIGALAGAMAGASYEVNIWAGLEDIIENFFIDSLEDSISYFEGLPVR